MIITAFTAGVASAQAVPFRQRKSLSVLNQSQTATIYIAFDAAAVAAPTAGQITLGPLGATGQSPNASGFQIPSDPPWSAVNIISSAAATPVTLLEGQG